MAHAAAGGATTAVGRRTRTDDDGGRAGRVAIRGVRAAEHRER